ncbi:MAG: alanine--tRNA ligase [Deltaproteobacteria bacterium]|nr:alanine--tRNA ligase [Deltaproteobacteria bacterium]
MRTGKEIREIFLHYFARHGHTIVESSPLVPKNDPTLLFTNAGMVQFKGVFLGMEKREYTRATSSQKCFRASGKHNDLENVGHTARHHTFFEMLGNFSFGDYFKEEAIARAWDFLVNHMELPPEKLWVTVFEEDDEAERLWNEKVGVSLDRIVRMGKKDNFWAMGETGPCGPCSEIIFDQGPEMGCGNPKCAVGCECDRFLELWNLVFMQFNQNEKGERLPLPKPSIDTGMGLERIAAVIQGVKSNYECDLLRTIIAYIEKLAEKEYGTETSDDLSMRVIADHSRAVAFLLSDGVLPSNEGRGYVLRRVIRRAIRHGKKLGLSKPFLYQTAGYVADIMGNAYPELVKTRNLISQAVQNEEGRFLETLEIGLSLLQEEIEKVQGRERPQLPGEIVFKLYDTYGFPVDLTADIARERNVRLDEEGFNVAMASQRAKAREAWKGSGEEKVKEIYQSLAQEGVKTDFIGYESLTGSSTVTCLLMEDTIVGEVSQGETACVITSETPFYGETGGQVGDTGLMEGDGWRADVVNTLRPHPGIIVHQVAVAAGKIRKGDQVRLTVDGNRRKAVAGNHTATHLLQAVLREVLGDHVHQEGSLVTAERFRFDFTHFSPLKAAELERIEALVNQKIREDAPVRTDIVPVKAALEKGAMALFGEKYGETVRMVEVGDYSRELCGGTHAESAGTIGFFKVVSETGVAAGVRRIEAVTGHEAWRYVRSWQEQLEALESVLKCPRSELIGKAQKLIEEARQLQREIEKLRAQVASGNSRDILSEVKTLGGIKVVATQVEASDPKTLRDFADTLRDRLGSGIVVLGAKNNDKAMLVVMISKDLTGKFHAGELIKPLATIIEGKGGGRPDMAQAGSSHPEKMEEALHKACEILNA